MKPELESEISPQVRELLRRVSQEAAQDTRTLEELFLDCRGARLPLHDDDPE